MELVLFFLLQQATTTVIDPALSTILVAAIAALPATITASVAARRAGQTPVDLDAKLDGISAALVDHTKQDNENFHSLEKAQARLEGRVEEALKRG